MSAGLRVINSCWRCSLILFPDCGCSECLCLGDGFACLLPWPATQPPPLLRSARHDVAAHILLRSPTADATVPLISAPPLLPPASSHSYRLSHTAAVHTAVSRCPVRTAPRCNGRSLPVAAAASRLPSC